MSGLMYETIWQATLELRQYAKRLGIVWLAIFTAVSGPIAYQTFDPSQQVCKTSSSLQCRPLCSYLRQILQFSWAQLRRIGAACMVIRSLAVHHEEQF